MLTLSMTVRTLHVANKGTFRRSKASDQARQKAAQVIGVMMNMRGLVRGGRDMDGAHPHCMRRGKIALFILEHGGGFGHHPIKRENGHKGPDLGFGEKSGMLDAVNRIKHPA